MQKKIVIGWGVGGLNMKNDWKKHQYRFKHTFDDKKCEYYHYCLQPMLQFKRRQARVLILMRHLHHILLLLEVLNY